VDFGLARSRIGRIRAQAVRDPSRFAALARRWSEDITAPQGGDLGERTLASLVQYFGEDFEDAAKELPVGRVSQVVQSTIGFHIFKIESRTNAP
jgi:peptidyl-prolyl cis-trans isomerase SurA